MIFPDVRISQLEKEVEENRQKLENSQSETVRLLRKKTKPFALLTNNPKLVLWIFFSVFSGWKILFRAGSHALGRKKTSIIWKLIKTGWLWKLLGIGAKYLVKNKKSDLTSIGVHTLKTILKNTSFKNFF